LSANSIRPPPSKRALKGIARFVVRLRLAWVDWRVDQLHAAHARMAALSLRLSKLLRKT
jgi:hypothetical protein